MKWIVTKVLVLVFLFFCTSEEGVAQTCEVVMVVEDNMPASFNKEMTNALSRNLFCTVQYVPVPSGMSEMFLDQMITELSRHALSTNTVVLGVVWVQGELTFREYLSKRIGLLNLAPLAADAPSGDILRWRIEKQCTRLFAILLGQSPCPFPLCALHESRTLNDVDMKGRNLCPPCQMKLEKRWNP